MGTVFAAYGSEPHREAVLEFAAERAVAAGDDLFVYHIRESEDQPADRTRTEIEGILQRTAPDLDFETTIEDMDTQQGEYERSTVSKQKQLIDVITTTDREYEYVVMGNVDHGPIEEFLLSSTSEAVLDTHAIPVMLVPVTDD